MSPEKLRAWRALASDVERLGAITIPGWVDRRTIGALGIALREACDEIERLEFLLAEAERYREAFRDKIDDEASR